MTARAAAARLPAWIPLAFFCSGWAALLYQVVWQRALYAIFGINIESVTIVVTAFLVGLGVGSLVGGALSWAPRPRLLLWFGWAELCLAAFGLGSLEAFRWLGAATLAWDSAARAAVMFVAVLVPTTLMGATLPLLVSYAVPLSGNVGRTVGTLYFVNTAGSALGALAAVLLLLGRLGEAGSVAFAAALNGAAGLGTLAYAAWTRR